MMIDLSLIRASYANMSDEKLISFVLNEGHQISADAFQVIREEFVKRNLDFTALESSEEKKALVHQEKIQHIRDSASNEFMQSSWNYVFSGIEAKQSDNEIIAGLKKSWE